ncbi:MEDS domain-containing protein [Streptomyces sp. NPDC003015]
MTAQDSRARKVVEVEPGDHLCFAFADDAEQRRMVTAYLSAGLARGERVLYFADRHAPAAVLGWLRAGGVDPDAATASGQLRVATADDSYLASGAFDPDAMVASLREEARHSLAAGYSGLRVSGEMSWALREAPEVERLAEYEVKVHSVFAGQPASAICQYDARQFGPEQLRMFEKCHPAAVELHPWYSSSGLSIVPAFRAGERVLQVTGTVDYQATGHLAAALEQTLQWPGDVRVDMSALDFIDLAGLRVLIHMAERLGEGRRLRVMNLTPMLCQVISVVGWDEHPALVVTSPEVMA